MGQGVEESASIKSNDQEGSEQNDGVQAGAALARPVNIFKIQPQRELVEGQGCAGAVEKGQQAARYERGFFSTYANILQPCKTDDQQNQNSPNQVMNVAATDVDIVKGADVVEVDIGKCPGDGEGDEKSDRC